MDYDLTTEQVSEIQVLNAKIVALKGLVREVALEGDSALLDKLTTEMAKSQISYDNWFESRQMELGVNTRSDQHWNVDFKLKKLQLLG